MVKWLIGLLPKETIVKAAMNYAIDKVNEGLAKCPNETVANVAGIGEDISSFANEIAILVKDSKIDNEERLELLDKYSPILTDAISKVLV